MTTHPLTFDGGINLLDQSVVKLNQHVAGKNWWLDRDSIVRARPGNKQWNVVPLGDRFYGLWNFKRISAANLLMAYAGGTLHVGNQQTRTFTTLLTGLAPAVPGFADVFQDRFWFANRVDIPKVTDGLSTSRIGIVPPSAAPQVTGIPVTPLTITRIGTGTVAKVASGDLTPGLPGSLLTNDVLLCVLTQRDNVAASMSTDWTQVYAVNLGAAMRATVWYHRYNSAAPPDAKITRGAGDTGIAVIVAYRGASSGGSPIAAFATQGTSPDGTTVTAPSIAPGGANRMLVFIAHAAAAGTAGAFSGTDPVPTEFLDDNTTLGLDAGLALDDGIRAATTNSDDRTSTYTISANHVGAQVALIPDAGALPAEDHYYRYTYAREESAVLVRESNPSPESARVTNSAIVAQNDVVLVASTDAQITHIYLYRRSSTSVAEEKLVSKITNASQTYRDNVGISSLGRFGHWTESGGEEDHGYPPSEVFAITLHRDGRFYAWGKKSRLFYTRHVAPHYWPGASGGVAGGTAIGVNLIVNEDDGDEGQGLLSEGDDLLALKRYNVYRLLGDGPTKDDGLLGTWRVEKVVTRHGLAAVLSLARGPAGTFWVSDEGPVRVDDRTGVPRLIGRSIKPWFDACVDITAMVGFTHERYYFLFGEFPDPDGSGTIVSGKVYNEANDSWWPVEDLGVEALAELEDGTLLWGGTLDGGVTKGVVYEWDGQITDAGKTVTAEMTTRLIDPQPGVRKLFHTRLAYEARPGFTLTARMIPDQSPSYVEIVLKLVGALSSRIVWLLRGTKKLQGEALQLYLKSANALARPAIYYWQVLAHALPRTVAVPAPFFSDTVTDGRLDGGALTAGLRLQDNISVDGF